MKQNLLLTLCIFLVLGTNAQRNTIVIIADDLGTDYFGFYEDRKDTVNVPNIRKLLAKGIRFTNAVSNPVCSATRAGIFTGRYGFRTGVGNIVGGIGGSDPLDTAEVTIPRVLKMYAPTLPCANIGKWHLQQATPTSNLLFPNVMGYDVYKGPFIGQITSYTNWTKYTNGVASTVTTYATTENVNDATTWVKAQSGKQFFLWLAFNAPHSPYHLPPSNLHTYNTLSGTAADINNNPKSYFKAMIQAMDTEMGRFFDSLKAYNRFDSTDFIFLGDNGNTTAVAQITETDRAKGTIYQYGTHVPFIISGPTVVNPGRVSDALVNTADIFATVLELYGRTNWQTKIPANKPVDSKSILPIIKNTATSIRPWAFTEIFKTTTDSSDGKAIRNLNYKLIKFDYGKQEFYNLSTDPLETVNLLTSTLTATDVTNYNYLCGELKTLVGGTWTCNLVLDGNAITLPDNMIKAYPNPFHATINVQTTSVNEICTLVNSVGQVMYEGTKINQQNFSALPKGIYLLILSHQPGKSFKLLKE